MPSYTVTSPSWFSYTQELRENTHIIGTLTMLRKWSYMLAEAKMPDRTVRFGYKGWASRNLFMQDASEKDIAAVKSVSWLNRDTVLTMDNKDYTWKRTDWWGMRCGWFGPDNKLIMEFHMNWWGKLQIHSVAPLEKTELLLAFFGMYLMKLWEMDAAAAGT